MKKTIRLIVLLTCLVLCAAAAQAATNYWDINGATAGAGGPTPSGTWDAGVTANWSTNSAGGVATTTWTSNDNAVFSAGSDASGIFSVGLSGTPAVGNLTVEEGTVTISGGAALNIGGAVAGKGIINVFPNKTLTISSVVTGGDNTGSIAKGSIGGTGTGTLVFSGANTYNGQTTVFVGTLSFNSIGNVNGGASALGNPTNAVLGTIKIGGGTAGATLQYTGSGHTTDRVLDQAGATGGATLEAAGSGPIIFTSANGVTATGTDIKMLSLTGTNTADNTINGTIVNSSASYTRLEKRDAGTWVLKGTNTYSGVTDIRAGTLVVNSLADAYTPSAIGSAAQGGAHIIIGLGNNDGGVTNATLKYIGSGHSSDREIRMYGTTGPGGGIIDASGTGPLVLIGNITRPLSTESFDKTLTLKGSNTDANTISGIIADGNNGKKTFVSKEGPGKWVLTGFNSYTGTTVVNGGTLLVNSPGYLYFNPAADLMVSVNSGATLGGTGSIWYSPVTIAPGGTLSPGDPIGTLTFYSGLTLSGNLFIEVDKSLAPANDAVWVSGPLINTGTGTVTVANLNPDVPLVAGDSFQLFNKPVANGGALTVVSAGGEVWTNKLAVDGSIAVLSVSPPAVPATNLTITSVGPTSFRLGGLGAANSAYNVYAATNVTTPKTNWWLIGTTNSNAGGLLQFLDAQATNKQRFYRFSQ